MYSPGNFTAGPLLSPPPLHHLPLLHLLLLLLPLVSPLPFLLHPLLGDYGFIHLLFFKVSISFPELRLNQFASLNSKLCLYHLEEGKWGECSSSHQDTIANVDLQCQICILDCLTRTQSHSSSFKRHETWAQLLDVFLFSKNNL